MATAARRVTITYEVAGTHARWLLDEDDAPESALHDAVALLLVQVLLGWKLRHQRDALIGRNMALRWDPASPRQGVDPDVYLVEPTPPGHEDLKSLCTWKPGVHPPRVAVEVVSENTAAKDYGDGPERYAASGTRELWVFDPLLAGPETRGGPSVLQVWRRDSAVGAEKPGAFRRVYAGNGPARSEELGAWLVVTDAGRRLRIADDPQGQSLWPTEAEAKHAALEASEAEVARLREELARLRGGKATT